MTTFKKLRRYIFYIVLWWLSLLAFSTVFADIIIPGDINTSLQIIKRLLVTIDGSQFWTPIADLNTWWNIIFYSPIKDAGGHKYITGYTESDPIFSTSAAFDVTNTKIWHWEAAYSRGNHAVMWYLTSQHWNQSGSTINYMSWNIGIWTQNPNARLEVNGSARFGDSVNYIEFEADGTMRMNGASTVWDDMTFPVTAINPAGTATAMTFDPDNIGFLSSATATQSVAILAQMPHSWKAGSSIQPHIHWMPTTTNGGNVLWRMEYKWTNTDDVESSTWTAIDALYSGNWTAWKHQMASFGFIDWTGKTVSSMLVIRISRIGGDVTDTYTASALLREFDIHYEMDTLWSRERLTK